MNRTIYDRIRILIDLKGITSDDLAEKTGIKYSRWTYVRRKDGNARGEEVEAICKLFPEYQMWIATGSVIPEAGQISPELEETVSEYGKAGTATD
jgi:hypothetical protein